MSRIEAHIEAFLKRAHRAMRCGMTAKFLRQMAKDEGILDYLQIYAKEESL